MDYTSHLTNYANVYRTSPKIGDMVAVFDGDLWMRIGTVVGVDDGTPDQPDDEAWVRLDGEVYFSMFKFTELYLLRRQVTLEDRIHYLNKDGPLSEREVVLVKDGDRYRPVSAETLLSDVSFTSTGFPLLYLGTCSGNRYKSGEYPEEGDKVGYDGDVFGVVGINRLLGYVSAFSKEHGYCRLPLNALIKQKV